MTFSLSSFNNTNILVSGGAGFVGSNLVKLILANAPDVRIQVVDNLLSSERENLPDDKRITFTEGSIADPALLAALPEDSFDYIFHLSTYHGNQSSMHDPLADHENNLITTLRLMERVKNWKRLKKLVYSAAGCAVAEKTYGEAQATSEDAAITLKMDSPYSISKIVGEFYCVYYHDRHQVPTVRARFQNVFGPGEVLGAGRWRGTPATVWRNVTPTFVYKSIKGEALPIEGDGSSSRDFIFVEDIARGLSACALNGAAGDVYNLASGKETTILELATAINEFTGNTTPLNFKPRRDWDKSGCRYGDPTKAKEQLGFETQTAWRDGLRTTVQWTKDNLARVEKCIHKHDPHIAALTSHLKH
jgi:UDP-glucose 4-epimerase